METRETRLLITDATAVVATGVGLEAGEGGLVLAIRETADRGEGTAEGDDGGEVVSDVSPAESAAAGRCL